MASVKNDIRGFKHSLEGEGISVFANVILEVDRVGQVEHHCVAIVFIMVVTLVTIFVKKSEQQLT